MDSHQPSPIKEEPINTVRKKGRKPKLESDKPKQAGHTCGWCRGSYPHSDDCSARGHFFSACGKPHHFSKVCCFSQKQQHAPPKKTVSTVEPYPDEQSETNMDYDNPAVVHVVRVINLLHATHQAAPMCLISVQGQPVSAFIGIGAFINLKATEL
ncbi:hypothetical protein NDU88_006860 [Pleurodeles waltl]|uniref:Uncharacterized protein n=1 Tax=Pleurodeles waltl TaxID=8319 RepID=A0AAV7NUD2_PLEWA|nr:hypothetical protein NDU88_006860 [Pleurodeles waltl]